MRHGNFYRRVFVPAAKEAGLPGLRFHDLRHFYASLLISDPHLTPLDVAKRMGHADATMVLRVYGHLFDKSGEGLGDRVEARRAAARARRAGTGNVVALPTSHTG